jgi:hypothetical protein
MRRTAAAVLAALCLAPPAATAASEFTIQTDPTEAGTVAAPRPLDTKWQVTIGTDATGGPAGAVKTVTQTVPAELVGQLPRFAECPASTTEAIRKGNQTADACPKASILGRGVARVVIPILGIDVTTDRGVIFKSSDTKIHFWYHASQPTDINQAIDGVVSQDGRVVSWDWSVACCGPMGEVRVARFATDYLRATGDATAPPAGESKSCRSRFAGIKNARKRRKAVRRCRMRRRRAACKTQTRSIKDPDRRKRAMRRCLKVGPRKTRAADVQRERAAASQAASERALFASTGCASGAWKFEARVTYKDDSTENLTADAACGGASSQPPPVTPPPCALPPLCPASTASQPSARHGPR